MYVKPLEELGDPVGWLIPRSELRLQLFGRQ
jgi:hypothetical protein